MVLFLFHHDGLLQQFGNNSQNEKAVHRLVLNRSRLFLGVLHRLWNAISPMAPRSVLQPYGIPFLLVRGLHP